MYLLTFVASVLNVTLNLVLIPRLGFEGAALATVVAMTLWNVVLWAWASRQWGINSNALSWTRQRSEPSFP